MKKRVSSLLLAIVLMVALSVTALASEPQLYHITDDAAILTAEEDWQLEELAEELTNDYGVGIYVVTVDDYRALAISDDVYETAYSIYHTYTLGEGAERSGIILLLSMAERDYALFRYGERAEYAFTEYGMAKLEKVFLDDFADDDWYAGLADYISECGVYLTMAASGKPVRRSPVPMILIWSAASLLIALIVVAVMRGMMKSVRKGADAGAYAAGGLTLAASSDHFTHRTETRRKIETSSSSGSGGGARTGGGGAGRSGKF